MLILGIESSCDETAAALVRNGRHVLSSVIDSQIERHRPYGGVVPEIASRGHVQALPRVLSNALMRASLPFSAIDAIAVTHGPGLASSLLIGLSGARALGQILQKPVWGVHHLEAHLAAVFLDPAMPPPEKAGPVLVLMVSGGHTCLIHMPAIGHYHILGQTLDDAAGECMDKGAKMLGLPYPGGPSIEKAAVGGDPNYIRFPRGMEHAKTSLSPDGHPLALCFSFSGLKTALLYHLKNHPNDLPSRLPHLAASYQTAIVESLALRTDRALALTRAPRLLCAGGVAKNAALRTRLAALCAKHHAELRLAPLPYCTDNAAMVAAAAGLRTLAHLPNPPAREVNPSLPLPPPPPPTP